LPRWDSFDPDEIVGAKGRENRNSKVESKKNGASPEDNLRSHLSEITQYLKEVTSYPGEVASQWIFNFLIV
jgi:hypothetical protein